MVVFMPYRRHAATIRRISSLQGRVTRCREAEGVTENYARPNIQTSPTATKTDGSMLPTGARRLLEGRAAEEMIPESGGVTVGRLREAITRQQQQWSAAQNADRPFNHA